jgi:hypothetical protein
VVWGCNSLAKILEIDNEKPDNGTNLRNKLVKKLNEYKKKYNVAYKVVAEHG